MMPEETSGSRIAERLVGVFFSISWLIRDNDTRRIKTLELKRIKTLKLIRIKTLKLKHIQMLELRRSN